MHADQTSIPYNARGRMGYHPAFHTRHNAHWTTHEQRYLIENYDSLGAETIGLALERTPKAVRTYAARMRAEGLLPPLSTQTRPYHKRAGRNPGHPS